MKITATKSKLTMKFKKFATKMTKPAEAGLVVITFIVLA